MKRTNSPFAKFRWQDTERSRLEGLRRSLQTTDRILSGSTEIKLRFSDTLVGFQQMGSTYAVSVDNDITINPKKINHPTSAEGIASILGLNYHELAHVLFSPQAWTNLSACYVPTGKQHRALHQHFRLAYMILEEARVETMMGAKYPNMRKYFAYPIFSIMLKDTTPESLTDRHLLLHGRRFLPRKIRDTYRKFFEQEYGTSAARDFEKMIDEYRLIPLTELNQKKRAASIIQDFAVLMEKCKMTPPEMHMESHGQPGGDSEKKQQKQEVAKQAKQQAQEQDEKEQQDPEEDGSGFNDEGGDDEREDDSSGSDATPDPQDGDGEEDRSDPAEGDSGGGQDNDQDGSDAGAEGGDGDPADGDGSGGSQDSPGSGGDDGSRERAGKNEGSRTGSGVGSGKGNPDQINKAPATYHRSDVKKVIKNLMEEILDDEEVSAEIGRYQDAMDDPSTALGSTLTASPEKNPQYLKPVTPDMLIRSGRIADELRQIWAKMDSGWDYGVSEGPRLNMERASLAREPEDYEGIYDDWEPGQQENSGMEWVILGDRSGSMDGVIYPPGVDYYSLSYTEREALPTLVKTVSQNIWELMHALQEIEVNVTVITYDSACYTLYERGELVTTAGYYELYADGGTHPTQAVDEARRILSQSTQPHKVLINYTDGGWMGDKTHYEESFGSMPDVVKVAALLGEGAIQQFQYKHLFDVVRNTSGDILDIMAEVVMEIMRRSIQ